MLSTLPRRAVFAASTAHRCCRAFSATATVRKDLVQDLYLKELRAYKPRLRAKDAHVGSVKAYTLPHPPKPPTLPANLSEELAAYDAQEPTKAETSPAVAAAAMPEGNGAEEFLEIIERDVEQPKHDAHH